MHPDLAPFRRCPSCAAEALAFEDDKALRCGACGFRYFHNVAVAVVGVLVCGEALLLTRRAHAPAAGAFDLPGGFVDAGESLEAALCRELQEELALTIPVAAPRYLFSSSNRYPFDGIVYRTSDVWFAVRLGARPSLQPADDVAEACWRTPEAALQEPLAFPVVREGLERLAARGLAMLP
ncbi:MAG: NUDIX domain-containing protein [Pseudomonadales bacterium]|nr:NUDIX domain-containing protein [Pseudomonadales bacterium]